MFLFSFMLNGGRIFPEDRHFNLPTFANIFARVFWWTHKHRIGLKLRSRYNLCFVFVFPCPAGAQQHHKVCILYTVSKSKPLS